MAETRARTPAQRAGEAAEALVAARLESGGWSVLGRNVRLGRAELDLVAVDPGPPPRLVAVEVRWRSRHDFGLPEETVDGRKRAHLRHALARLVATGRIPGGRPLPALPIAVDVVAVEPGRGAAPYEIRHIRDALDRD